MFEKPWLSGLKYGLIVFFLTFSFMSSMLFILAYSNQEIFVSGKQVTRTLAASFILALEWGSLFFFLPPVLTWFVSLGGKDSFATLVRSLLVAILILLYLFGLPLWSIPLLVK